LRKKGRGLCSPGLASALAANIEKERENKVSFAVSSETSQ
jgi:hypothetical protein